MVPSPSIQGLTNTRVWLARSIIVGVLLLCLFTISLTTYSQVYSKEQYKLQAETETQNLSFILEAQLAGSIDNIKLALFSIASEYERQMTDKSINHQNLNEFVQRQKKLLPYVYSLAIANEAGQIIPGIGLGMNQTANIAHRDYFTYLRDYSSVDFTLSKPLIGKINGKRGIILSHRISMPDGSFAGVVNAVVTLDYFEKTFSALNIDNHGVIALRNLGPDILVRYPRLKNNIASVVERNIVSNYLNQETTARPLEGTFTTSATLDHLERTFSYKKVGNYPLYIFVGLASEDYLREWHAQTIRVGGATAFFSILILLLAFLVSHLIKKQQTAATLIQTQKDFLGAILDSEPECVKIVNSDGSLDLMNPVGLTMFEVESIDEVNRRGLVNYVLPEYRESFSATVQRALQGKKCNLEYEIEGAKGTRRWLDTHASPLRQVQGDISAIVTVTRDVTARKYTDHQLQETKERLEAAASAGLVGVWDWDIVNNHLYWDKVMYKLYGLREEDFTGAYEAWTHAIHSEDKERVEEAIQAALHRESDYTPEFRVVWPDGSIHHLKAIARTTFNKEGIALRMIGVNYDLTEQKTIQFELDRLAFYDRLTGLPNRRLLEDRLQQSIARASRDKLHVSLLFIDLDKFKPVNDEFGHRTGDWLLQQVTARMLANVRSSDTLARIGGDEFVAVLPDISGHAEALQIAEKLRAVLALPFAIPEGPSVSISASIGVVIFPEQADNARDLLHLGDDAMYRVKKTGRNAVVLYTDPNEMETIRRCVWTPDLACGEPTIDREHQDLFIRGNALLDMAMKSETEPSIFWQAFDSLLLHVDEHFKHEEEILRQYNYANLNGHSRIHKSLLKKVKALREDGKVDFSVDEKLVGFLATDVIVRHVLREDKMFYEIFKFKKE